MSRTVYYIPSPWYLRYPAGAVIWSAWLYLYGTVIWYHATAVTPPHNSLVGDLAFLAVFAWLILLDDPPANYDSWSEWREARNARLAQRKHRFTPLPPL